jgi:uncharacterized membrane protein YjfL (UPF0719 family)
MSPKIIDNLLAVAPVPVTRKGFELFRKCFGLYLIVHFGALLPYAGELFSHAGVLPQARLNPLHGLFPNPLAWGDSPLVAQVLVAILTLLSALYAYGIAHQWMAVGLWFGATALFHRNNLTSNPSLPYIALTLLLTALIPSPKKTPWEIPKLVMPVGWILLALGYTFSGLVKLQSPSWVDGSAIARLMENPLARDWSFRDWMLQAPSSLTSLITWGSLALEILFLPFCLHPFTRKWASQAMIGMHLSILLLVDFADLTLGMLMLHAFLWDPTWFKKFPKPRAVDKAYAWLMGKKHSLISCVSGLILPFVAINCTPSKPQHKGVFPFFMMIMALRSELLVFRPWANWSPF